MALTYTGKRGFQGTTPNTTWPESCPQTRESEPQSIPSKYKKAADPECIIPGKYPHLRINILMIEF